MDGPVEGSLKPVVEEEEPVTVVDVDRQMQNDDVDEPMSSRV